MRGTCNGWAASWLSNSDPGPGAEGRAVEEGLAESHASGQCPMHATGGVGKAGGGQGGRHEANYQSPGTGKTPGPVLHLLVPQPGRLKEHVLTGGLWPWPSAAVCPDTSADIG